MVGLLRNARDAIMRLGLFISVRFRSTGYKVNIQDTITLERMHFTNISTLGELHFDGVKVCYTLEDTCRRLKIDGETAIPAGKYEVIINDSMRFKRRMPLLLDVPGFEGVRIHSGNTAEDTEGCILVGMREGPDIVYDSRKAFEFVFKEIENRLTKGKLYICVIGGVHA